MTNETTGWEYLGMQTSDPVGSDPTLAPSPPPPPPETNEADDLERQRKRADFREGLVYCFKVFLGVRIGLGVLALLATALLPANPTGPGPAGWDITPLTPGWHNLFTAWERWDALWFLRIATGGYAEGDFSAAFFPLYPLLIKIVSPLLGGHPYAAAMLISNAAGFGALAVVYQLTKDEFTKSLAKKTVLYIAIFPTALFFVAPYTESLFLLLSAGALFAARRARWEAAGILGALAAATRSIGLILALPLLIEAWHQARNFTGRERWKRLWLGAAWSAFVAVGTLAYFAYWQRTNGEFLTPLNDQNGWLREFSFFWDTIIAGTREAFRFVGAYSGGYHQVDWILVMVALAAAVWVCRNVRPTYWVYTLVCLLVPLSLVFGGRPFMSMPRFILVMFPLFWAIAHFAERYKANDLVVALSAGGLGVMTVLYVNWYFVF